MVVLTMSSCMREVPIVSLESGNETTNMTLSEQREWVGEQFDIAIEASAVEDGWFKTRRTLPWTDAPGDRDGILNMLYPRECSVGGRLVVSLQNRTADDPFAAAEKVRAFWESEGWTVSDIRSYESDPYFRADREDGAVLAFRASTGRMSLEIETSCSVHGTVTNWQYRDEEGNEFTQELERRGGEAEK
ncbi:hypothetical protein [Leucobacter chromiiresistens]|uniref:hypothetical protein n=1 Tax=Leucobacter chromiiresistens TaxID=1079994 RepID=UPI00128E9A6B|nr:hypothetical protein [Leucobacter chromiiresistens]